MDAASDALARLTAERDRLLAELAGVERAIGALRGAMGREPVRPAEKAAEVLPPQVPAAASAPPPLAIPTRDRGPFSGYTFYHAAAIYLAGQEEPKTSREIADALRAGGFFTLASNFRSSARTMLKRRLSIESYGIAMTDDEEHWYFREKTHDS